MKKVLLIQALSMEGIDVERVYPIGLVTLASLIERSGKYDIELLDMNLELDAYGSVKNKLAEYKPDIIALSLRNLDPLGNRTNSMIVPFGVTLDLIKHLMPDVKIIVGGTAFSLFPERIMQEFKQIDLGIVGEAENNIIEILDNIECQIGTEGLIYRKGEKVIYNAQTKLFDMQDYKMPNRELLSPTKYLKINKYVESVGVETKRGCVFNCAYCSYPLLQGRCMRCRDAEDVVDEIEYLKNTYGVTHIHLTDSIVNFPAKHLDDICRALIRRNVDIKWSGFFREDTITPKNAELYVKSGCECFSLSPDGLTQSALDILDKKLSIDTILHTSKILADTDITSVYHFLINIPFDTEASFDESKRVIDQIYDIHSKSKTIGTIVLNLIRIMPRTKIQKLAIEEGFITEDTDLLFPIYYNPEKFRTKRYELEMYHNKQNVFIWNDIK